MRTRVLINGARGKMGRLASETIRSQAQFELVGELGRGDALQRAIIDSKADIVIELTTADCVYANSLTIINNNVHPIIGASGLLPEQVKTLQALSAEKKLGGVIVPNFSIAAVLMMHFASLAARFIPNVEIIEGHHAQKQDAPSGTAIKTAEMIAHARTTPLNTHSQKELLPGARGAKYLDVPIHSLRLPGLLARQEIIFGQQGETLSICHNTLDRNAFMPGIVHACERVLQLQHLYYGLEHLLDLGV